MHIANLVAYHLVVEGIRVAAPVAQRYAFVYEHIPIKIHFEEKQRVQGIIVIPRLSFCVRTNNASILHKSGSQLYFRHTDIVRVKRCRLIIRRIVRCIEWNQVFHGINHIEVVVHLIEIQIRLVGVLEHEIGAIRVSVRKEMPHNNDVVVGGFYDVLVIRAVPESRPANLLLQNAIRRELHQTRILTVVPVHIVVPPRSINDDVARFKLSKRLHAIRPNGIITVIYSHIFPFLCCGLHP